MCVFQEWLVTRSPRVQREIRRGAYVLIRGGSSPRALYDKMAAAPCAEQACSCHLSDARQYRCECLDMNLLFGEKDGSTWLQLEHYPIWHPGHAKDALVFALYGMQSGPDGHSPYSDANPLLL